MGKVGNTVGLGDVTVGKLPPNVPIITRHVRADGLTRTLVFSLTYTIGTGKKKAMVEIP